MQHWTEYWKNTNALNSFAEGKQGQGYQKEVASFWSQQFSEIDSNSKVVDLGTGNGAVAVLAQQFSHDKKLGWQVFGLDAADIDPNQLTIKDKETKQHLNNIQFIANTPIEKSPFQSGTIDAFISQFAFEYSNLEQSLNQCMDCLKPGGIITMFCHHPESHISKDSLIGEGVLKYILQESPAFLQTDLLLDTARQQTKAKKMHDWPRNPKRQAITTTLHWVFSQLTEKFSGNSDAEYWCKSTISQIANILKQIGSIHPAELKKHLEKLYHNLEAHRSRLQDQNMASLSEKRINQIKEYCKANGLALNIEELNIEDKLFAYHLSLKK